MTVHIETTNQELQGAFLPPVRGLVLLHNRGGASLRAVDVERWLRLVRTSYRCEKADLLAYGDGVNSALQFVPPAARLDLRLSLRTDASAPPPSALSAAGLLDVFLTPPAHNAPHLDSWLEACREAGLPARLQWTSPLGHGFDPEAAAERAASAGIATARIAAHDPFVSSAPPPDSGVAELARMNTLIAALRSRGIDTELTGVPFCLVDDANRSAVVNSAQARLMHGHYHPEAHDLAAKLYGRGAFAAAKAVQMLLARQALWENPIDMKLLPWIVERPWIRARVWALHKVTRHLRQRTLPPVIENGGAQPALPRPASSPVCGACSLRRICDQMPEPVRQALPGVTLQAQPGDLVLDPLHFARERLPYADEMDRARLRRQETWRELAEEARGIVANRPPDREVSPFDYRVENTHSDPVHGGVRWFSFTGTEKLSTPLARVEPPFTLSVVVGGGMAEHAGFAVGRRARILCPMTAYDHILTLHADAQGNYVLLRDGEPVRPVEFEGNYYAPPRLGSVIEPRLALWNIDGEIVTQNVRLWTAPDSEAAAQAPRFSFLVVCTRYARRLQASLLSIANQRGVDPESIEIVLAHVPGYDAAEDVIRTLEVAYPGLRIVRSTFSEANAREKGFMINESARLLSGEWTILIDADILLPPDFLERVDALPPGCSFAAPDGRKMLEEKATAEILLGRIDPAREWQALLDGPGEFRQREAKGVPIGYCQIVRTKCLDKVQYDEYGHFEGADYRFGVDMRENFGQEIRLEGMAVLHLHHGGSQWYGTQRHY